MNFDITNSFESVYIHWPFCPYKCHFCPFVALASHDHFMEQYHDTLCKEIRDFSQQNLNKTPIRTVFLGGGTPSTYPNDLLLDMFGILNNVLPLADDAEISIEVNPGTVTPERLATWKRVGINRLSIGVQSLKDDVLKKLNRHQSAADVMHLLESAQPLFENISVDIIVGLPGVNSDDWKELIQTLVTWPIKHVSMYYLTVHEDTPLYFGVKAKKITLPTDETMVNLYEWSVNYLAEHGFGRYEISNFARPGYESRHNSAYWHRKPYKGFGLGACSFDGKSRFQNQKNLMSYFQGVQEGQNIHIFSETLTAQQEWLEIIMLGLRQARGVRIADVLQNLTHEQKNNFFEKIDFLRQADLLVCVDDFLRLTAAGFAVENEIVLKLSVM